MGALALRLGAELWGIGARSGGIPRQGEKLLGGEAARGVGLEGEGGHEPRACPVVGNGGFCLLVVGIAHGGKLVGGELFEVGEP